MRIAFLLVVHKNFAQFQRLFRLVYDPADYYLVHVDRKSPPDFHAAVRELVAGKPNVRMLESTNIVWGGWSLVALFLRAIHEFLHWADDWSHFTALSGQDFPLQPVDRFREFLAQNPGRNYVDALDMERDWPAGMVRVRFYWFKIPGLPVRRPVRIPFIRRRFLPGARAYQGSQWVTLSRPFCEFVDSSPEVEPYRRFFRTTGVPDEVFFQTLLIHSPFADTRVDDHLRYIIWTGGSSPKTLVSADVPTMLASGKFFGRKFEPGVDARVMDELEAHIARAAAPVESPPT